MDDELCDLDLSLDDLPEELSDDELCELELSLDELPEELSDEELCEEELDELSCGVSPVKRYIWPSNPPLKKTLSTIMLPSKFPFVPVHVALGARTVPFIEKPELVIDVTFGKFHKI